MLFVRHKFRHIEHNNATLCTQFPNLSFVLVWHLLMTQQNDAVSNLHRANFSGAPSVVWNSYFIFVHLVAITTWNQVWNQYEVLASNVIVVIIPRFRYILRSITTHWFEGFPRKIIAKMKAAWVRIYLKSNWTLHRTLIISITLFANITLNTYIKFDYYQ